LQNRISKGGKGSSQQVLGFRVLIKPKLAKKNKKTKKTKQTKQTHAHNRERNMLEDDHSDNIGFGKQ
jgi:hypothetical protein